MAWLAATISSSIGKKSLMAVSGFLLGVFVLVHMLGNATALAGRATFLSYAEQLHAFGGLLLFFELALLAIFLCHLITALLLWRANCAARPVAYAVSRGAGGRTIASRTMLYSGLVILLFLGYHLAQFSFGGGDEVVADLVRDTLGRPLNAAFYLIALLALALHLSHGFWSLWQSLGVEHPKYTPGLRRGAVAAAILIGFIYSLLPLFALLSPRFLL